MADTLYRRSVLIEVVNKQNNSQLVEAFTLTLPPDSIEIVQSQRINRTHTFGGVFEDDYGLGTAKITISGTTGNQELRSTYIPGKGSPKKYSGKEAIYEFRNKIIRYKVDAEEQGLEKYELRMYDLSVIDEDKWNSADPSSAIYSNYLEAWVISLDDFKISRTKEKPFWYNYSIDLFGIAPLDVYLDKPSKELGEPIPSDTPETDTLQNLSDELGGKTSVLQRTRSAVKNAVGVLRRITNTIKNSLSWGKNMIDKIDNVNVLISDLLAQIDSYNQAATSIITSTTSTYRRVFNVAKFPAAAAKSTLSALRTVIADIKDTVEFSESLQKELGDDYFLFEQVADEALRVAAQIVTFGKSNHADSELSTTLNGEEITIYGITIYVADATTTLSRVASEMYGDPDKGELIALYNSITDEEVVVGTVLKIPKIVRPIRDVNNKIYSWDRMSNFGRDIKIDKDGKIVFAEGGDFSIVSEENNMVQAVNLRLNERLGARLRLVTYGISASVGDARSDTSPVAYIISNLVNTLRQDPRIKQVENIKLLGAKDVLSMSFNLKTVQSNINYQGVL